MREALLLCLVLLLVLSIAVIGAACFFLNAALPVINKSIGTALQTTVLEGLIVLVIFLFMAVIFLCSTNLGPVTPVLQLVYGLFILFEILKQVLDRSP